jgi:hypothetical protein
MSKIIEFPNAAQPDDFVLDDGSEARENEQILTVDGDAESRAHAFRGALLTLDMIPITAEEFWAVFDCPGMVKSETSKWVVSALEKLSAIAKGM